MNNEFTAIIERDGEWYIARCPEVPGANGQGETRDEARESLAEAISFDPRRPPRRNEVEMRRKQNNYMISI